LYGKQFIEGFLNREHLFSGVYQSILMMIANMLKNISGTGKKEIDWLEEIGGTSFRCLLLTTVLMDRMRLRACDFIVGGSKACC
jgi:preprotein translocase subunit SecY